MSSIRLTLNKTQFDDTTGSNYVILHQQSPLVAMVAAMWLGNKSQFDLVWAITDSVITRESFIASGVPESLVHFIGEVSQWRKLAERAEKLSKLTSKLGRLLVLIHVRHPHEETLRKIYKLANTSITLMEVDVCSLDKLSWIQSPKWLMSGIHNADVLSLPKQLVSCGLTLEQISFVLSRIPIGVLVTADLKQFTRIPRDFRSTILKLPESLSQIAKNS